MRTLLTAATLAAVIIATAAAFTSVHNANNRRAEYLNAEAAYLECVESGLSRAECAAAVGW